MNDGRVVRIICTDRKTDGSNALTKVLGLIDEKSYEILDFWTPEGHNHYPGKDIVAEVTPFDDFEVDEPVLTKKHNVTGTELSRGHFAGVSGQGLPMTFIRGCTSWSAPRTPDGTPKVETWDVCIRPNQDHGEIS